MCAAPDKRAQLRGRAVSSLDESAGRQRAVPVVERTAIDNLGAVAGINRSA